MSGGRLSYGISFTLLDFNGSKDVGQGFIFFWLLISGNPKLLIKYMKAVICP